MEFEEGLPNLTDAVLPELSIEEVGPPVVPVEEAKDEDFGGLGTFRELPGNFDTGAPLAAMLRYA